MPEEEKERSDPLLEHADAINEIVAKHYQLRVALNLIPVVGGSLSELFGGRGSQILEERRDRLLRSLSEQMQDLDERTVRKDHFETEEGFDLLIKALDEALRTRSKEKIALYARILMQSATTYRQGRYFPEEYLNVLAGLTPKQVEVGWSMYEVQEKPREGYDPEGSEAWRRQSEEVCKRLGLAQSQVIFMLKGLVASGLVAEIGRHQKTRRVRCQEKITIYPTVFDKREISFARGASTRRRGREGHASWLELVDWR